MRKTKDLINNKFSMLTVVGRGKIKWVAQCKVNGVRKCLGSFQDIDQARLAYEKYAMLKQGDFSPYKD